MFSVDDVYQTIFRKGCCVCNLVIYVSCDSNQLGNSGNCGLSVDCHYAYWQAKTKDDKDVSLHGMIF